MKSVICKAYEQIQETGTLKLFKSYRKEFPDGGQMRDFVYVKDCAEIIWWLLENSHVNGLFNIGTGQARTWNELANAVFEGLNKSPNIQYIDMPDTIKEHYQYFTKASIEKLKEAGCPIQCRSLEAAVSDYLP
jgi:ADP-L-glycero-D-manno-heptose 6-epimerase